MAITVMRTNLPGPLLTVSGTMLQRSLLSVTGMTPSATNVVTHGLGHTPQVVGLNNWGASGPTQVFDSTQGYQDAGGNHLGYDSTNVYVITPAGRTTCQLLVEHGR